jgi:thymidine phosphorylase
VDVVDVIRTKRDGGRLSDEQIKWFIQTYTDGGTIADEQASALLMAIVWRGMEPDELSTWARAMLDSGEVVDLSGIAGPTADKHSTGGVGDKVSLPLAPIAAACGLTDPMMSGRGLGHTGGTLDKLEAIPGFRVDLSPAEVIRIMQDVGCVIYSSSPNVAPADRKLYALRDVTGTVESIPLIASSIMSKKIAEGAGALVLDVKVGSGAFLPNIRMARQLAETMVTIGEDHGVKTMAMITDMSTPLGRTAGNALEVTESVEMLEGKGPSDLDEITYALVDEMLDLCGVTADPREMVANGSALEKWRAMVKAQGGDPDAALPEASERKSLSAPRSGFLTKLDARAVGIAAWRLGAGRARKEDPIDHAAGIVSLAKPGDRVEEGQPLLELHASDPARFATAEAALEGAFEIGDEALEVPPLIIERIKP